MRKIVVVIERRADYSRFRPVLMKMKTDPFFELHLAVTGICLLDRHGKDIQYIMDDGLNVEMEIAMFTRPEIDSGAEMIRGMSRAMMGLVDFLEIVEPDLVLSGFDIGANFAVTVAAAHMNIPVAHIQGGEVSGSIDESIRHAMSKFAHIHFPATELSKERLIRMGENPDMIHVVGCPSLDVIVETPLRPLNEIGRFFDLDFFRPVVLMIQHPVTTEQKDATDQINETIEAIRDLDLQAVALLPNNDAGCSGIIDRIRNSGMKWYPSLPTDLFVNLYRNVSAIVGNSSSGIHESCTLKIPAVNIGSRQQGRERPANVIDTPHDRRQIRAALEKALFDQDFRTQVAAMENPYGDGHSADKIISVLKTVSLVGITQKRFYE